MTNRPLDRSQGLQLSLFGHYRDEPRIPADPDPVPDPDAAARAFAVDPNHHVVLEASAGTGKTSVLVSRYVNLVQSGVDPANILAITFTRKAAAEMRERIAARLRDAAERAEIPRDRWVKLRDQLGEITISTIDAFCLSLLREFPLEADLDPAFQMADETEVPRIVEEALDRALRILVGLAKDDPDIALVLAQLGIARTREGLASLLDRRLVARDALDRFLARGPSDLTPTIVCRRSAEALYAALLQVPGGLPCFLADGPVGHSRYQLFAREVARLCDWHNSRALLASDLGPTDADIRGLLERIGAHFLTNDGEARREGSRIYPYTARDYPSRDAERGHREAVFQVASGVQQVVAAFHRDLNVVLARGVRRMFAVALEQYRRALEERSVLDFTDALERALDLLRNMSEFSQSRYRLEYRYHHVLVDEFQDTSRAQWELISLLIQAWGEGLGLASQPSIFVVGDRKQSIYRFRDAEVRLLREAAGYIDRLRPAPSPGSARRSISRSFRAVPALLAFVNDLFAEMTHPTASPDDFTFDAADRFPVDGDAPAGPPALGLAVGDSPEECAAAVASEVRRILDEATVRDRDTGVARPAMPGDIAVLFRSRSSHREFERALIARGIPTYVYKGLGFFDADEIKDITALLRYLATPVSDLRAAAVLRSRFFRLSDAGLAALAPNLAGSLTGRAADAFESLEEADRRVLRHARVAVASWLTQADRVPPSDLLEQILQESAYAYEIRGPRRLQAWENVKKMRALIRRMQNRGYATLARVAAHLDAISVGDESNAVLEAADAVNLMTIHASKGLEFPVVFVVNLSRGASGPPRPVRVSVDGDAETVSVGPFASESDEAGRERDKHETRRLLYVAMTRARDRLYLSTSLKDGVLVPGRGSLAEVLPDSLAPLFARARGAFEGFPTLAWRGASGTIFEWRLCQSDLSAESAVVPIRSPRDGEAARDVFGEVDGGATVRRSSVTGWLVGTDRKPSIGPSSTDMLTGTLAHRLFEHSHRLRDQLKTDEQASIEFARDLLRVEERASVDDPEIVARAALDAWHRMQQRPEVVGVLESGTVLHEVPFSLRVADADPPLVLRGTIDCLVRRPDGSIVVVELKTGRALPWHEQQIELYVRAVCACHPGARVERLLVYL